jgi:hypothetical protein
MTTETRAEHRDDFIAHRPRRDVRADPFDHPRDVHAQYRLSWPEDPE